MANQHTGSIEHVVQTRFNCSAQTWLEHAAKKGLSYDEASSQLGMKQGTIRKWCGRFGLRLRISPTTRCKDLCHSLSSFKAKELNPHNFLSRVWRSTAYSKG